MDTNAIAKNLNKNVDVVESTFSQNNLQVISYGFCGISENGNMTLLIEIASINGSSINSRIDVKANFYNEDGVIIYSESKTVYEEDFAGYDTLNMYLNEDGLAFNAIKCRLFAVRFVWYEYSREIT